MVEMVFRTGDCGCGWTSVVKRALDVPVLLVFSPLDLLHVDTTGVLGSTISSAVDARTRPGKLSNYTSPLELFCHATGNMVVLGTVGLYGAYVAWGVDTGSS